jgi:[histone H3]-lysine36 N-dimethyltransferase SETMAR
MASKIEQRYAIKFCFKLRKSATETIQMLSSAYGESSMTKSRVHVWYNRFKNGQEQVLSQERSGRPTTSVTDDKKNKVDDLVRQNRRITVRDIEEEVGISFGSAQSILSELGYSKVCARWVPRLLTDEQRQNRVAICVQWRSRMRREGADNFLKRVVTCDETWVHHYDPETKQESSIWKHKSSPRPEKAKVVRSAGKVMHLVFFDHQGIIYDNRVPKGQTVTGNYYSSVLKHELMKKLRKKRPELIANGWLLHHDNAPAHTSRVCRETMDEIGVELLAHPPYSPDLAPCDHFLFPELKKYLRGNRYGSDEEVNSAVTSALKVISKDGLWHVFEKWQNRWNKCIEAEGHYFEGS